MVASDVAAAAAAIKHYFVPSAFKKEIVHIFNEQGVL